MQMDVENVFNNISQTVIFKKLWNVESLLVSIIPFIRLFYGIHFFLHYQHEQHEEGVTIIKSSSSMKQGNLLKGFLFSLIHYGTFLKTITQAPNYVFPSLADDTHIMSFMNKIVPAFYHLST